MLGLLIFILPLVSCNKSVDYLIHYGYLDKNALTEDITLAVKLFQEVFHLQPTGILDNATLELIDQPRCGVKDDIRPFMALPNRKWHKSIISWYWFGPPQYNNIVERAFAVWGKHINVTFKREINQPTIFVSPSIQKQHMCYSTQAMCVDFDGRGGVLAHAFLPNKNHNQTDVHLDSDENWDYTMNLPQGGNVSFFLTLVHEIGHALGLDHSSDINSIMFPYISYRGIADLNTFTLSKDDILAIQFLYGTSPTTTTPTTSTTTTTTSTTSTTTTTTTIPPTISSTEVTPSEHYYEKDLCELKGKINTFLIANIRIFAFYRNNVWILSIDARDRTPDQYKKPKKITDWLRFLPHNFTEISAIYQKPDGRVALFADDYVYFFQYPQLNLNSRFKTETLVTQGLYKVNTVISTNQGRTFFIYNDYYLNEIKECTYTSYFMGRVSDEFYGIPSNCLGAFRYVNGNIYFITDNGVLEYNEFTNTVTRSISDVFEVLEIPCIRETLLNKLYELIKYIQ
jgi:hypothetical protein